MTARKEDSYSEGESLNAESEQEPACGSYESDQEHFSEISDTTALHAQNDLVDQRSKNLQSSGPASGDKNHITEATYTDGATGSY